MLDKAPSRRKAFPRGQKPFWSYVDTTLRTCLQRPSPCIILSGSSEQSWTHTSPFGLTLHARHFHWRSVHVGQGSITKKSISLGPKTVLVLRRYNIAYLFAAPFPLHHTVRLFGTELDTHKPFRAHAAGHFHWRSVHVGQGSITKKSISLGSKTVLVLRRYNIACLFAAPFPLHHTVRLVGTELDTHTSPFGLTLHARHFHWRSVHVGQGSITKKSISLGPKTVLVLRRYNIAYLFAAPFSVKRKCELSCDSAPG